MGTCGSRLRDERKRLRLSQDALAAIAGLARSAQIRYEKDERAPDANYLAAVAGVGVDVQYVVTGVSAAPSGGDEAELLQRYRKASPEIRMAVFAALGAVLAPSPPNAPKVQISGGEQAQVIAGDVRQKGMTINVGRQKGGKKK